MPFTTSGTMTLPNAAATNNLGSNKQTNAGTYSMLSGGIGSSIALAVLIAMYVIWSVVQQHEKLRDQVKPSNIAANFHNLLTIFLSVIVSLGLVKLLIALLLKYNVPGVKPVADAVEFAS